MVVDLQAQTYGGGIKVVDI